MRKNDSFLFPPLLLLLTFGVPCLSVHGERLRLGEVPDPTEKPERGKKAQLPEEQSNPTATDRKQTMDALVEENYRHGSELMRQERFREAKRYFERALILSPDHQPSRENLRVIKRLMEKQKSPAPVAVAAPSIVPAPTPVKNGKKKPLPKPSPKPALSPEEAKKRSDDLYAQALTAIQEGNPDQAFDLCKQALKLDAGNLQAERMCERLEARREMQ